MTNIPLHDTHAHTSLFSIDRYSVTMNLSVLDKNNELVIEGKMFYSLEWIYCYYHINQK
jgi:hypothetical protein